MIRVRALSKRYAGASAERLALDAVDAQVKERECIAIVGPSGCGKSTFLRCLNALEPFDGGQIDVAGFALAAGPGPGRTQARALREAVGMVFQDLNLFPHLSALENVALAPRIVARRPRAEAMERGRELLGRVGLGDRADAYPSQLSGGQKQRVAIARAIAMPLKVLLLDEPTSALDPAMREEVREVVRSLARENALTLVLATHEMRLASELADRVWAMRGGKIVADGAPADVLASIGAKP
ncbi:MAG TPA: amino acid ABC transporter ATP-binding protein [Polyangiaceae bacterium]|jgi:polar amino acid transport system ATP-binding protein|nr:amino acid ABC transporter ATP-binding protein [Polyangiaceae bacterium]